MTYNDLITFGDVIRLRKSIDTDKLMSEIKGHEFYHYNSNKKEIPRYGLSVTYNSNLPHGVDLESLFEYNKSAGTDLHDSDFNEFTSVYHNSHQLQYILEDFKEWIGRTHILKIPPGGYFPPHTDPYVPSLGYDSMRMIVPITNCNPPNLYFSVDEVLRHWEHGRAYFINTNKMHHLFSYDNDTYMLVVNIKVTPESVEKMMRSIDKL